MDTNVKGSKTAKGRTWIGYVLFAVVLIGFSLYFCFPSEALRDYLEGSAARAAPGLALRIHKVRPVLPFGLKLEDTNLVPRGRPGFPIFKADSLLVTPSMRTLTLRRPALRFDCEAYGGRIEGVIAWRKLSRKGPIQSDIKMTSLLLGQYPRLRQWLQGELTGAISGAVTYEGPLRDFLLGSGEGDLSILDGSFRFPEPFLGMEFADFDRIEAQMVLEEQRISLASLDFEGKQMKGKASGTIDLNPIIAESSLNLRVVLKAFSAFLQQKGSFTIAIRGTIRQPQISFI